VQKYDLEKIELYLQKHDIIWFFLNKIDWYSRLYPEINIIFTNLSKNDEYYVVFDRVQIEQVIDNLLNNSLRFIPKVDWKIQVEFDVISQSEIVIRLRDNGWGFKNGEEESIFEKYSTWNSSTWIGMGLYLCKKIIELHSGNIFARNSIDFWGAEFEIKINTSNLTEKK
jgi:signal transduction histidine kinase